MTEAKAPSSTVGRGAPRGPSRPVDDIARMGSEIYERDIKAHVVADHDGEIVAIDVDSGDWAIAKDLMTASDLLREKRPDANDVFFERVGFRSVYSFGGGPLRRND